MRFVSVVCALILSSLAVGQTPPSTAPKITVAPRPELAKPTEQLAKVGELVRLTSSSPKARWELAPDTVGADLEPAGEGKALFTATTPGRYLITNYVCDAPAAWLLIIVGNAPAPPAPTPPGPPSPPAPQPSPLARRLTESLDKDGGLTDPNRQTLRALLALVGEAKDYASKPEIKTASEFVGLVAKASRSIAKDAIPATRAWLIAELRALVGDSDFTLTTAKRAEIRDSLTRLETAINEVLK